MSLLHRLWKLEGTVDRITYLAAGVIGFAVKYTVDWLIATAMFGRPWSPLSYWRLIGVDGTLGRRVSPEMFLVLLCVSLPFLWFMMATTLLRLRDAGRSAGWAALLFVPFVNLALVLVLVCLPARRRTDGRDLSGVLESALFAVVASVAVATAAIALSTRVVQTYGIGLFVAIPFSVGYLSAFLHRRRYPDARVQPFVVAVLSILLLGGLLLAIAWEGLLCLVMALPLALGAALIGASLGGRSAGTHATPAQGYLMVAALPLLLIGEAAVLPRNPPAHRVDTTVVIDAPIQDVWRNVVSFPDITAAPAWYFRAGIAYPLRATISGRGAGAIRRCEFTTGTFVEPVEVWNEPRLLRFGVTSNPPPMHELSPYGHIDAPHLKGFLVSRRGQFALRSLPDGRTELTGTTWYQHHLWPAAYWTLWSDAIIHRIHLRVLFHIREVSERGISITAKRRKTDEDADRDCVGCRVARWLHGGKEG
jgi:uncharacterized membrane protein YhaH (DUF805 family)